MIHKSFGFSACFIDKFFVSERLFKPISFPGSQFGKYMGCCSDLHESEVLRARARACRSKYGITKMQAKIKENDDDVREYETLKGDAIILDLFKKYSG